MHITLRHVLLLWRGCCVCLCDVVGWKGQIDSAGMQMTRDRAVYRQAWLVNLAHHLTQWWPSKHSTYTAA